MVIKFRDENSTSAVDFYGNLQHRARLLCYAPTFFPRQYQKVVEVFLRM